MNANRFGETYLECDKMKRSEGTSVSYAMAIIALRERYQEGSLLGEGTRVWLNRMSKQKLKVHMQRHVS